MSFQDIIFSGLNSLQSDSDLHGALQHIINSGAGGTHWTPSIDIVDTKNNLYVYMEIPGVSESSISVDFFNNKLSITGEKVKKYTTSPIKREIVYGSFKREMVLPISVTNQENVTVQYENGVLILVIDKKKEEQNRFRIGIDGNLKQQNKDKNKDKNKDNFEEKKKNSDNKDYNINNEVV